MTHLSLRYWNVRTHKGKIFAPDIYFNKTYSKVYCIIENNTYREVNGLLIKKQDKDTIIGFRISIDKENASDKSAIEIFDQIINSEYIGKNVSNKAIKKFRKRLSKINLSLSTIY